jgi:hypothetical protein
MYLLNNYDSLEEINFPKKQNKTIKRNNFDDSLPDLKNIGKSV